MFKKLLLFPIVLFLSGCVKPSIELKQDELTKTMSCSIKDNRLKVLKNASYAELSFFSNSGESLKNKNYKIKGYLIIHQPNKIYHFKDNAKIIFNIDGADFILKTIGVYNLPTSSHSYSYVPIGGGLIPIANIKDFTITTYKFMVDKQFLIALSKGEKISIKLEKNENFLDKKDNMQPAFVELELDNENIQIFDAFHKKCLTNLHSESK